MGSTNIPRIFWTVRRPDEEHIQILYQIKRDLLQGITIPLFGARFVPGLLENCQNRGLRDGIGASDERPILLGIADQRLVSHDGFHPEYLHGEETRFYTNIEEYIQFQLDLEPDYLLVHDPPIPGEASPEVEASIQRYTLEHLQKTMALRDRLESDTKIVFITPGMRNLIRTKDSIVGGLVPTSILAEDLGADVVAISLRYLSANRSATLRTVCLNCGTSYSVKRVMCPNEECGHPNPDPQAQALKVPKARLKLMLLPWVISQTLRYGTPLMTLGCLDARYSYTLGHECGVSSQEGTYLDDLVFPRSTPRFPGRTTDSFMPMRQTKRVLIWKNGQPQAGRAGAGVNPLSSPLAVARANIKAWFKFVTKGFPIFPHKEPGFKKSYEEFKRIREEYRHNLRETCNTIYSSLVMI